MTAPVSKLLNETKKQIKLIQVSPSVVGNGLFCFRNEYLIKKILFQQKNKTKQKKNQNILLFI